MQPDRFTAVQCPVARSLDRIGTWWSIMILRDAFRGLTRFDQFRRSLGIAPNILSRQLRGLVKAGVLERSRYSEHPPRDAYLLTERGRDFRPVLWALIAWGNKHFMPECQAATPADSGQQADPRSMQWNQRPDHVALHSAPYSTENRSVP